MEEGEDGEEREGEGVEEEISRCSVHKFKRMMQNSTE
jgi:hypothetical protein